MKRLRQALRFVSRVLLFWPATLTIWLGRAILEVGDTAVGRLTIRPVGRIIARWVLYARSVPMVRPQSQDVIPPSMVVYLLAEQKEIAVMPCPCRATARACRHPLHTPHESETCLSFGVTAILQRMSGLARKVTADEARRICDAATASGMVHHAILSLGMFVEMCNCCPASCTVFAAHRRGVKEAVRPSGLKSVRSEACDGCKGRPARLCVEICAYAKGPGTGGCMGCGLCASRCPRTAIQMVDT